ncbi:MAG: hypothetical protein ACYTEL_21870, partial [Planctomycetota bacterium]
MRTVRMIMGMVIAVLVLTNAAAGYTQYYVDCTGSDDNNCLSWPNACKTIQKAIDLASNGDFIDVNECTYYETIDYKGKTVKVRSTDTDNWTVIENTVIDA